MASFDIDSIKSRMISSLQTKQSWDNLLFYNTNLTLVEIMAEQINALSNFDVYLFYETKWANARNRTSLLASQDIHNYKAKRKYSSTGTLRISSSKTFDASYGKDIYIPQYTYFATEDGKNFLSDSIYVFSGSQNYIDIGILQGKLITTTFTSIGGISESYNINSTNVENDHLFVYVNDLLFTEVSNLYEYTSTDNVYAVKYSVSDNTLDVVFGDGIFGKRLTSGDKITIKYVDTLGLGGNIPGAGSIKKPVSVVRDTSGNAVTIYCNNTELVIGGKDEEDIESIRNNAVSYFQTGDRAVTKEDYETIIKIVATYIIKITVWGAYEQNLDADRDMWTFIPTEENLVNICALNSELGNLTQSQKDDLSLALLDRKSPTDILKFYDANVVDMLFFIDAFVKDKSYLLNIVDNNIRNSLNSNYGLGALNFFEHVYFSDYTRVIDEANGVSYHNTQMKLQDYFDFDTAYACEYSCNLFPITLGTVEVFIKDIPSGIVTKVAEDNSLGNIIGVNGYDAGVSAINYNNGVGNLFIKNILASPITDYKIFIRYKVENNNAILKSRTQILNYNSEYSEININYVNNR